MDYKPTPIVFASAFLAEPGVPLAQAATPAIGAPGDGKFMSC